VPIGVYPMVFHLGGPHDQHEQGGPTGWWGVKWGCSDIDYDDILAARNLCGALKALGIPCWLERSRSKGYHVWVFAREWVRASVMRRALLVAHEVSGVPPAEVNPKQENLAEGQVGNYVRLPYPGYLDPKIRWSHPKLGARRVMLYDNSAEVSFDSFVQRGADHTNRPATEVLEDAALLWSPPPVLRHHRRLEDVPLIELSREITDKLGGLAFTIFRDGPLDGRDRSGTLYKLAALCAEDDLTPPEAQAVLADADSRWGKYHARRDGERYLRQTIERAYESFQPVDTE